MENLNYYAVTTICGHVGRKNYIVITFPVQCESKKEAAKIARYFPRVKHDRKDAIKSVEEITYEEYESLLEKNRNDSYLKCKNKQEQRIYCKDLDSRIYKHDTDDIDYKELRFIRKSRVMKKLDFLRKQELSTLKHYKQRLV